jgi:sterol desaturase/sphingolipid hydroxylase (fatty acid hydroxylase superfamily)
MEEPEESQSSDAGFNWRGVGWNLWLSRALVGGIAVWLIAGAIRIIIRDFFIDPAGYVFSPNEFTAKSIVRVASWALAIETIAFRAWLGAAVLLGFLWVRDRPASSN